MIWLTLQDLELIHLQIIDASGGSQGVRDSGRLESALAAMRQEFFGAEPYPKVYEKAAVLLRGIIADHPFVDGNRRSGIMAALVFLNLNYIDTTAITDKGLEDFAVAVTVKHYDVPMVATWLRAHAGIK